MLVLTLKNCERLKLTWPDGRTVTVTLYKSAHNHIRAAIEGDAPRQPTVERLPPQTQTPEST